MVRPLALASLAAAALIAACAGTPRINPQAEALRSRLTQLQDDPQLGALAPVAMVEADRAIRAAETAAAAGAEAEQLIYLATSRVEIARAQAERRLVENRIKALSRLQGPVMLKPQPIPVEPAAAPPDDGRPQNRRVEILLPD